MVAFWRRIHFILVSVVKSMNTDGSHPTMKIVKIRRALATAVERPGLEFSAQLNRRGGAPSGAVEFIPIIRKNSTSDYAQISNFLKR